MFAYGLCVDERYLAPALVTISSLANTLGPAARKEAAVRVLTLDLSRSHAVSMDDFVRRVGFGSFDLAWCRPPGLAHMADAAYISVTTYLRFQFTSAFVARPYLIYVDADVLALEDISAPLATLGSQRLGAVVDEFNLAVGQCRALPGLAERWPIVRGRPYYNAGVLWLATALLPRLRRGVDASLAHGRRHILHNDQDALNLWLLRSGAAQTMPARFNQFELGRFLERSDWVRRTVRRPLRTNDTALLHYVGRHKPWLQACPPTEHVRLYRAHLSETFRHLRRLGELGIGVQAVGGMG